jgi:hypothetical protein
LLEELSASLRAFLDDLAAARLADRVLVLVFSEFGRRVAENGSKGTDHGTAGPVLLAGPCVRPGLHGPTRASPDLVDGDLKIAWWTSAASMRPSGGLAGPAIEASPAGGAFESLPLFLS